MLLVNHSSAAAVDSAAAVVQVYLPCPGLCDAHIVWGANVKGALVLVRLAQGVIQYARGVDTLT